MQASGAPWPPAAMSRARTSETTGTPVASTIQAGWPICSVPRARPSCTQWKTVCPCEQTSSPPAGASSASTAAAAAPLA